MNSQTPAALTQGPGGNGSFYDEKDQKSDERSKRSAIGPNLRLVRCYRAPANRQRKSPRTLSPSAGSNFASAKFSSACSMLDTPTSAVVMPGADRANWSACCAEVRSPGKRLGDLLRKLPRQAALQNGCRAECRQAGLARGLAGPARAVEPFCCERNPRASPIARLNGSWTPRKWCPSPATSRARSSTHGKRQMLGVLRRHAKAVPRREPPRGDQPVLRGALQEGDRRLEALPERRASRPHPAGSRRCAGSRGRWSTSPGSCGCARSDRRGIRAGCSGNSARSRPPEPGPSTRRSRSRSAGRAAGRRRRTARSRPWSRRRSRHARRRPSAKAFASARPTARSLFWPR